MSQVAKQSCFENGRMKRAALLSPNVRQELRGHVKTSVSKPITPAANKLTLMFISSLAGGDPPCKRLETEQA